MNIEKIVIEKLEYRNSKLYVYYNNFINKDKMFIFENIKSFTYTWEEMSNWDEKIEYLDDLGIEFFSKIFYRNRKKRKIYIFDANYSMTTIEFNEEKEWNYRKQKN